VKKSFDSNPQKFIVRDVI